MRTIDQGHPARPTAVVELARIVLGAAIAGDVRGEARSHQPTQDNARIPEG